jgi:anti-sigma factor RsiW
MRRVSDVTARLSAEEIAELCALADGTLPAGRRAGIEARVAASPELQELLERQRRSLLATQTLAAEESVPESLQAAVEADRRALGSPRARRRKLVPRFALVAAAAIAAAVAAVVLTGGPGAPTVADAARLAAQAPTGPAPAPAGAAGTRLAVGVEGVAFPNYAQWAGWRTLGVRHGRVDGRSATVVFYGKGDRRMAYVIVSGSSLSRPSGGQTTTQEGVEFQTLRLNGRPAVTWRRGGHTCILIGQAARAELLTLAGWPLTHSR